MNTLTPAQINHLAYEAPEIIGFISGAPVAYDVAGYERCVRSPCDPASLPRREHPERPQTPLPAQAQFAERSYITRLAGFRRQNEFGPDEIGRLFRSLGIAFSDGLGNGLYESLLIARKYGLSHVLEAPIMGFPLPFLDSEWPAFEAAYPPIVARYATELERMAAVYGRPFIGDALKLVVLWARGYPLEHFWAAYQAQPQAVEAEMTAALAGAPLPLDPQTPAERLAQLRFWNWIRAKQARIHVFQADVLRQALGPQTWLIANPHELPVLDFDLQARAFDMPSVAMRPLLLDDPLMLRDYTAYFTQLFADLTGKAPMVSVRMNLSAATPQFIPSGELIRAWYDQAVRHGAGGFYFWTRDYPPQAGAYDGPIPGNPVPQTYPTERWQATLDALSKLARARRFQPPPAQVCILIPTHAALLNRREQRRIYAAFSALTGARIQAGFVSDRQIEAHGLPGGCRLLLAPELEFLSPELREQLELFVRQGGRALTTQTNFYDQNGQPCPPPAGIEQLPDQIFDVFPPGQPGDPARLEQLSAALAAVVAASGCVTNAWVFDVRHDNLPPSPRDWLHPTDESVIFGPWLYEHGSEWIMPYLSDIPLG